MQTENKQRLLLLGKVILSAITTFVVLRGLGLIVFWFIPENTISTPLIMVITGGSYILAGLITIALFVKVIDKEAFFTSDWFSLQNGVKDYFIGGLLGCICILLGFLIIINLNWNQVEIAPLRIRFLSASFFMFLCSTFFEELVFRGYMLRKLLERFSPIISLSLSSLIFCLVHCFFCPGITIVSIINIFLASLLLGMLFIKTKNIWLATGFHFLWNYIQSILGFNVSGGEFPSILYLNFDDNLFNGGYFGFEGSYVCTIILLLALCFYYKKATRQNVNDVKCNEVETSNKETQQQNN